MDNVQYGKDMTTKRINRRKIENSKAYRDGLIGTRVSHTDSDGTARFGEIVGFGPSVAHVTGHGYPIVRFDDGRSARLELTVTLA